MRRSTGVLVAVVVLLGASCSSGSDRPTAAVTTVGDWFTANAVPLQAWSDASARVGVLLGGAPGATARGAVDLYSACRASQAALRDVGALTPTADPTTDARLRSAVEQGVGEATSCLAALSVWPSDRAKLAAAKTAHEAGTAARQQAEARSAERADLANAGGRLASVPSAEPTSSSCADLARVSVELGTGSRPDPTAGAPGGRRFFVQAQVRNAAHRPVVVVVSGRLTDPRKGDSTGGTASDVVPAGARATVVVKGYGLLGLSDDPGLRWDRRSYSVRQDGLSWDGTRCRAQS